MLQSIIALLLVLFAIGIKIIFFKRAGFKNPKRFYSSFFKWYNQRNIWEVQGIKPRIFMKISNGFNILFWLGIIILMLVYILYSPNKN